MKKKLKQDEKINESLIEKMSKFNTLNLLQELNN